MALDGSLPEIVTLVSKIVAVEQPVHVETAMRRVRDSFWSQLTRTVREHIASAIELAVSEGSVSLGDRDGAFLTVPGAGPAPARRRAERDFQHIADAELEQGLILVARKAFGLPRGDLIRETARQFQFRVTRVENHLDERIAGLLESGRMSLQET